MRDNLKWEIIALIEYCKIFNLDIGAFRKAERPDFQPRFEGFDIGIECTNIISTSEHIARSNSPKTRNEWYVSFVDTITESHNFPNDSQRLFKSDDAHRLFIAVKKKTQQLNEVDYGKFSTNALVVRASSTFSTLPRIKEFVKEVLKSVSLCGEANFNPVIISKDDNNAGFECLIVDTNDYTITEHHGKRTLSKNERSIVDSWIEREPE